MNAKKILCPVDFSPSSQVAFEHAVALARTEGATLVLAHVTLPPPAYVSGPPGYGMVPPYPMEPDTRLDEWTVSGGNVPLEKVHLNGSEGESIVHYANENNCDLIVMGTHGYGGLTKLLLGSVAEYVLRHADCRVVVIKHKHREQEIKQENQAVAQQTSQPGFGTAN